MEQNIGKKLKYSKFLEEVRSEVEKELGESVEARIYPVIKNNGKQYDGLIIMDNKTNISPSIYLNPYFYRYIDDTPMEEIIEDIIKTYRENLPTEDFNISLIRDFEKAKENIIMKLVNTEQNKELLEQVPSIPFYDLSLVFLVDVSQYMEIFATTLIYDQYMDLWNITVEDLYEIAKENTPKCLTPRLDELSDVYECITGEKVPFVDKMGVKILTNHIKINGATCIAYTDMLKELYSIIEGSFYIIPSSIHEVLIVPVANVEGEYSLHEFSEMVGQVNVTELSDMEVLSDHAYLYDGEKLVW